MELAEIKARMKDRGLNQGDLANLLGIDPTAISKRLSGKRPFKHHEMVMVEQWLSDGETPQLTGGGVRMLPIIGQVSASSWREAIQQPLGHRPVPEEGTPPNAIVLEVQGDSMDLEVEDGGQVVVDTDDKALFPGRLFVVANGDGETTFKQFEAEPARLVPRSSNPAHRAIQIGDGQSFTVLGRVVGLYRRR